MLVYAVLVSRLENCNCTVLAFFGFTDLKHSDSRLARFYPAEVDFFLLEFQPAVACRRKNAVSVRQPLVYNLQADLVLRDFERHYFQRACNSNRDKIANPFAVLPFCVLNVCNELQHKNPLFSRGFYLEREVNFLVGSDYASREIFVVDFKVVVLENVGFFYESVHREPRLGVNVNGSHFRFNFLLYCICCFFLCGCPFLFCCVFLCCCLFRCCCLFYGCVVRYYFFFYVHILLNRLLLHILERYRKHAQIAGHQRLRAELVVVNHHRRLRVRSDSALV